MTRMWIYLGITHHSYADKLLERLRLDKGSMTLRRALYWSMWTRISGKQWAFWRRAPPQLSREFLEQRWGNMMLLGGCYLEKRWSGHSSAHAISGWSCRDFSPSQFSVQPTSYGHTCGRRAPRGLE